MSLVSACAHPRTPAMAPELAGSCRSASLRWFGPDDQKNRERLDAWCAGVGPVVLSKAAAEPAEAIELRYLTFVSWNVHVGNGDVAAFVKDLRAGRLTNGRPVGHVVLLLQEVVRLGDVPPLSAHASGARRIVAEDRSTPDIRELCRALGMWMVYAPSMRNGRTARGPAADRGNAILSTLPLSEPTAVELPFERQRRVALVANVSLSPAKTMSVGVIHLDALGGSKRFWLFGTSNMRALQAKSLMSLLPSGALVLGADLNTWHGADEPAPRYFKQLFADTRVVIDPSGPRRRVLDYLFFRAFPTMTAHYEVVRNQYGSDHHPLVGWIQ
jgi:endonuclease/exonuclease/phosphatase family metal-dependent hydrolase